MADHVDRVEDLAAGGEAATIRASGLTGRDIEGEALARLARRGYDWAGTPGRQGAS